MSWQDANVKQGIAVPFGDELDAGVPCMQHNGSPEACAAVCKYC